MAEEGGDPPTLVSTVKEEVDASNFLELQMDGDLQEPYAGQFGDLRDSFDESMDDLPPPVLQPEVTLNPSIGLDDEGRPQAEGEVQRSLWYQCKYCSILLEDAMVFLFHIRRHEGSDSLDTDNDTDPLRLETQLTEAGVTIFSPAILAPRVKGQEDEIEEEKGVKINLPPMPRLTRAPPTIQQVPPPSEDLPRQCKLCVPHINFGRRSEFIDHLFVQHRVDREFICSKAPCSFRTRSVQFLEKHMEEHEEAQVRVYTCHLCTPKTKWIQSTRYAQHMRDHLDEDGRYNCPYCKYSTPSLQLFNKHTKNRHSETGGGAFARKTRPASVALQYGKRQGPLDRQFLCYFCSKSWISRKQYESHMILRHRNPQGGYNCAECEFVGESIRLIARHFKFRHGSNLRGDFVQVDRAPAPPKVTLDMSLEEYEEAEMDLEVTPPPALVPQPTVTAPSHSGPKNPLCLPTAPKKSEVPCPLCNLQKSEELTGNFDFQVFDHIFQNHCRDNAIFCPSCSFRSTSLETTVQHARQIHRVEPPQQLTPPRRDPPPPHRVADQGQKGSPGGKITYFCRFCMTNWNEVSAYSAHMKQHLDGNGNYVCPYCFLPYPTLNRFNEHVKRRHEMAQPIRRRRNTVTVLPPPAAAPPPPPPPVKTVEEFIPPPPPRLPTFKTSPIMTRRLSFQGYSTQRRVMGRGSGSKKSYACFYCDPQGLTFLSVKLYSRHMRELHMNVNGLYTCPICPTVPPTSLKKINEHMKRKSHPALMKKARARGPLLANLLKPNPETRTRPNHNHVRPEVTKPNLEDMTFMDKVEVKVEGVKGQSSIGKKWFQCKVCFILVETKEKLVLHQKIHQQSLTNTVEKPQPTRVEVCEVDDSPTPVPPPPRPVPPLHMPLHKCKLCIPNKWFRSPALMDQHMRHSHPSTATAAAERPKGRLMTCLFCHAVFNKQTAYIKHMNETHTDESGVFHCHVCKVYSTSLLSRATKHIRRHFKPDKPASLHSRRKLKIKKHFRGKTVDVGTAFESFKYF